MGYGRKTTKNGKTYCTTTTKGKSIKRVVKPKPKVTSYGRTTKKKTIRIPLRKGSTKTKVRRK